MILSVFLDGTHWDTFDAESEAHAHNQAWSAIDAAATPRPDETKVEKAQRERMAAIDVIEVREGEKLKLRTTRLVRARIRVREKAEMERFAALASLFD